jgi:Fe-S-cluster containining protein
MNIQKCGHKTVACCKSCGRCFACCTTSVNPCPVLDEDELDERVSEAIVSLETQEIMSKFDGLIAKLRGR